MSAVVAVQEPQRPASRLPRRRSEVRLDIQGLRAIAVGIVVLFHAWPHRLTGGYVGVDVFFVISGFLISAHLLAAPPKNRLELGRFWVRRARRLLPASLFVITVTLVLSRLFAPALQWASTAHEAIAAALYVENWSLAHQALDYLAADAAATPVQHFWSLSVEEQFYLVWPLLIGLTAVLAARFRRRSTLGFGAVFAIIVALSLAVSVQLTRSQAARAYFVTWTRAWEFAGGGLVAWLVWRSRGRWTGPTADLAAWLGLGMIGLAAVTFTARTPFPGYAALLPVLGTALVIGARSEGPIGPGALWRLPGVRWLGDISYSIYLWHWPLLLLAPSILGTRLSWPWKLLVLTVTLVLSGLTKVFIEDRYRAPRAGQRQRRTFAMVAVGMAGVVLLGNLQLHEVSVNRREAFAAVARALRSGDPCLGAAAVLSGAQACPPASERKLIPDLSIAAEDKSKAYADKCFTGEPYTARLTCTYGNGPTRVALVGNSHAGHWLPALERIAKSKGWTITTYLVSVCNVSDAATSMRTVALKDACDDYSRWVFDQTQGSAYDLILTSERQSSTVPGYTWGTTEARSRKGYASYLERWTRSGAHVIVLKDIVPPGPQIGRLPDCLAKNPGHREQCQWPHAQRTPANPRAYRWMDPLAEAAAGVANGRVSVVSVDDLLCPTGTCLPVVGGVITYFDASHLTATYATTLAPELGRRITAALARQEAGG